MAALHYTKRFDEERQRWIGVIYELTPAGAKIVLDAEVAETQVVLDAWARATMKDKPWESCE
jgi:hypothetical protein